MAQWRLTDNSTGTPDNFDFHVNPTTFELPGREAQTQADYTTAPSGQAIVFQGRDKVTNGQFGGAIITQAFYNDMNTWAAKAYPLTLTDDQGNTWNILITSFKINRVKRRNPWRYDYTIQFMEIT